MIDSHIRKIVRQSYAWAEKNFGQVPDGTCSNAALYLFDQLKANGYRPQLAVWDSDINVNDDNYAAQGHCYVVLDDYLLDITAHQFDHYLPPVQIRLRHRIPKKYTFWENKDTRYYAYRKSFVRSLLKTGWGKEAITLPKEKYYSN